jgi:hypothetical protein
MASFMQGFLCRVLLKHQPLQTCFPAGGVLPHCNRQWLPVAFCATGRSKAVPPLRERSILAAAAAPHVVCSLMGPRL